MRFNVSLKRFCSIVVIAGMSYFVAGCGEEAARESRSTTGPVAAESASPSHADRGGTLPSGSFREHLERKSPRNQRRPRRRLEMQKRGIATKSIKGGVRSERRRGKALGEWRGEVG